jgi:hypothetical protein
MTPSPTATATATAAATGTTVPTATLAATATSTATATGASAPTPTATATPAVSARLPDDSPDDEPKETEQERQDEQLTNASGRDDVHTEGHVVAVERAADDLSVLVTIALGPGGQERLIVQVACPRRVCPEIRAGDYLEADGYQNGVGDPNSYFVATDGIAVWRNGQRVR